MCLAGGAARALLLLAVVLWQEAGRVDGKNDNHQMSDICKKYFMRDLYRKIDGAVITSQNERELDCAITFQTHSILQRFMLRFDQLQLDCNDHLYIFDGAHAVGSYKTKFVNARSSFQISRYLEMSQRKIDVTLSIEASSTFLFVQFRRFSAINLADGSC
ncbi:hypothetical protein HN011_011269 [Eciton burchellii]|nr:hypothetical protein HN011_011269 [Eciton burchellii]